MTSKSLASTGQRLSGATIEEYFRQLEPRFTELRRQCDRLLNLNQDAMGRKAAEAAILARRWFVTTLGTAVALVISGIGFAVFLSSTILRPIRQLTDATTRVAAGHLDTVVDIHSGGELGVLAVRFNEMAERIRQLRQSDLGKILVAQQTAEAAVDSLDHPVIVTDGEGRVQRINRAAEPLFGPEAAVLGRKIQDVTRIRGSPRPSSTCSRRRGPSQARRAVPPSRWSSMAQSERSGSEPLPCGTPTHALSVP